MSALRRTAFPEPDRHPAAFGVAPAPALYDPAIGPNPDILRLPLDQADLAATRPVFLDILGQRQSVGNWSAALRYTLAVAHRAVNDIGILEEVSGCNLLIGLQRGEGPYLREIGATLRSIGASHPAEALRRTVINTHLPARIRIGWTDAGGEGREALIEHAPNPAHVPTLGGFLPWRPGRAPGLRRNQAAARSDDRVKNLREQAIRGEVMPGSLVRLTIEGVVADEIFRIVETEGRPANGTIGNRSPVALAILGRAAGEVCSYRVGARERRIEIHAVDNSIPLARCAAILAASAPAREPEPAPAM
ncbi:GreA/GreB family elongation factor [Cereibacter sphaeroides]|uniref:GreA/GreB family elongation factor n=1 Tax=Cereibacter sphaeroides TaxID=1063 RepID=UPI001F373154|nr:GreA/GreB family elongation factor [Cereibacter sphaeroides]MCE6958818.1 GreA/GreB family elongation factor [Cereibacter sphaeroides]MCE6973308.1 GreA/GreB family elongation factor [Cereibacter sphaeroides]